MPSGHELDTELARMRRTLRRLMAVMTFGLIIGVGAIAAVVGVTLSSADKEAARSFDAGWRKDNGKDARAAQVRPATVAQAPAASATPKPAPSRPETTGAATGQTARVDHPLQTTPDQAGTEQSKKPDHVTSHSRKKHSRRYLARMRSRPSDEERAYYSDDNGRSSSEPVLPRPGLERPQANAPSDYGGGRESPRGGLFGALFGAQPD